MLNTTVILNRYKRATYEQQVECVKSQCKEIITQDNRVQNLGVWARFFTAFNVTTKYVCVLDDDMFPESNCIKNCERLMEEEEALYGGVGNNYLQQTSRRPLEQRGRPQPNEHKLQCDIVGHLRFFKTERLPAIFDELPPNDIFPYNGEDMRVSYKLQQHSIKTYVLPHPKDDRSVWSTDPGLGFKHGTDEHANSTGKQDEYNEAFLMYIKNGFKLLKA